MYVVQLTLTDEEATYLKECAQLRGTSKKYLLNKLISKFCTERTVPKVLIGTKKFSRGEWHRFNANRRIKDKQRVLTTIGITGN